MATISGIRKIIESQGRPWTAELYDKAVAKYGEAVIQDEARPYAGAPLAAPQAAVPLAPPAPASEEPRDRTLGDLMGGWITGPGGIPQFNPLAANLAAGATRGLTAGIVDAPMAQADSGIPALDFVANRLAPTVGEAAGMGISAAAIPVAAPFRGATTVLGKLAAKAAPAAERLGKYGLISGAVEGGREGGVSGALRGAAERGAKDTALGLVLGGSPALPKWMGGEYGKSAGIMGGMTAASGGDPLDVLASAMTGAGMHAVGARSAMREGKDYNYERAPVNEGGKGVKGLVSASVRSTEGQLERLSPAGREVAERARSVLDETRRAVGEATAPLMIVKAHKLSRADDIATMRALNGTLPPDALSPKARAAYTAARAYLDTYAGRARSEGVKVRVPARTEMEPEQTESGEVIFKKVKKPVEWVPFPEARPDYAPHLTVDVAKLKRGQVRSDVLDRVVADGVFADRPAAERALKSYIDIVEKQGRGSDDTFAQWMVDTNQANTVAEAKGKLLRSLERGAKTRLFGSVERAREFDNPWWDPSVRRALPRYIAEAERRLAETRHYGQNSEILNSILGSIKDPTEKKVATNLAQAALGNVKQEHPLLMKSSATLRRLGSMHLSLQTAIQNLGQANSILLRGDVKSYLGGLKDSLTPTGRLFAHRSGATAGVVLRDVENIGGATSLYYKAIGMTGSEMFLRAWASNAGARYARNLAKTVARNPNDAFARNQLKKLRLNPDEIAKQGGEITYDQMLQAGFKMSDNTQFGYTPLDVPSWFNETAAGRLVSQFKPYGAQQARMIVQEVADEARAGNYGRATRALLILTVAFPASGEVLNDITALITNKKRESELLSLRRYLENITKAGVTNIVVDGIESARYGSLAKLMLGAAPGTAAEVSQTIVQAAERGHFTESEIRRLYRLIPLLGKITSDWVIPKEEKPEEGASDRRAPVRRAPQRTAPQRKPSR